MRIDVITLFPGYVEQMVSESIVKRAREKGVVEIAVHNLRDWATDKYKSVDDHPYGGGPGMVLKVDVLHRALTKVIGERVRKTIQVILLTPQGQVYKQKLAQELSKEKNLILIAGHYEGFDERIREYVDQEISIGDYVLTGGELAAGILIDSIVRLLPGALGDDHSSKEESHSEGLLEYPQYTRPEEYDSKKVPGILMGGNHKEIECWRKEQASERTKKRRPDLV
ncbi:MAG: tRNA (guanosine(37)-N1)-methyltransferase TrmD [bacterium]